MTEQRDETQKPVPAPAEQQSQQPASLPINDDDTLGFGSCGFGAVGE
jgi:hypothetical protein